MSKSSDKQVRYALHLLGQAGLPTDRMSAEFKRWAKMNERTGRVDAWLASIGHVRISALIDDLKARVSA